MLDGVRTGWKHIKKRSLPPHPSEGRGVQIKRGMRIDGKFINHHFIDYNLIVNRL
jgi:hypothetical protein